MLAKIAQYNTHSAHTIHNTQPHTAYKTHNTSARHITSHHITSHHITPHGTTCTLIYNTLHHTTYTTHHIAPQPKLAILLCPLDCVCGVGEWVVCDLFVLCVSASFACWVLWSVSSVWSLLSVVLCRVVISLVVLPLVSVVLSLLCVMRFLVHTSAWNNKRGLVAYFVVWGVFRFFGMVIVCSVRVCCVHW